MSSLQKNLRATWLALSLAIFTFMPAHVTAATFRVDDSASLPREGSALLNWRQAMPTRDGDDTLVGTANILLRLDVAAWMNRSGRLYLVLPEQGTPVNQLTWRTQGRLLPGKALPGQRVLILEGPIQSPWIEERMELGFQAPGSRLSGMQPLNFYFEIDVD